MPGVRFTDARAFFFCVRQKRRGPGRATIVALVFWRATLDDLRRLSRAPVARLLFLGVVIVAALFNEWLGLVGAALLVVLLLGDIGRARDAVWRAACASGDEAPKDEDGSDATVPAAHALGRLAVAIEAARRHAWMEAHEAALTVDRRQLRAEEANLLDGVRAMVELALGNNERAVSLARVALPTGSDDIDTSLGRAVVKSCWADPQKLEAIDDAWSKAGVREAGDAPLERLRLVLRARLDLSTVEEKSARALRAAAEEARALGEDALAMELTRTTRAPYR